MTKFPCGLCKKSVHKNHRAILCDSCNSWIHIKCNKLSPKDYESLKDSTEEWNCIKCRSDILPFINYTDSPSSEDNPSPNLELKHFLSKLNALDEEAEDISSDSVSGVNCKYYEVNEVSTCGSDMNNLSLFHLNIGSLPLHFDELKALLTELDTNFNILGITETIFQTDTPPSNCNLDGYTIRHQPTDAKKGGALLYISNNIQFIDRQDLGLLAHKSKELESVFIEIIQPNKKNIIIGCIYRHPSVMSVHEFNQDYLSPLLEKVALENKTVSLLGDFNIDLLKSSSDNEVSEFLDITNSYSLLPHIILPTRVTPTTASLIDNIFCTPVEFNTTSGNIISTISDHFPQFLILKQSIRSPTPKNNIKQRDWKNFDKQSFIKEVNKIDWDSILQLENKMLIYQRKISSTL